VSDIYDLLERPAWQRRAACRGLDPSIFFPKRDEVRNRRRAQAVCSECPVRDICLVEALRNDEPLGIWGGMTPGARRRIRYEGVA